MIELLIVITACFISAEIMIRTGFQRAYMIPLSLGCGLTITTLLAFVLAQIYETETWISAPFHWIIADPFYALLATILYWSAVSWPILSWQHQRIKNRRQLPRPLSSDDQPLTTKSS